MLNCDICKRENLYKVRIENGKQFCKDCAQRTAVPNFSLIEKVLIGKKWQLKSRVDEAKRQVMLPYERTDGKGGYYLGRRRDDGKIEERIPCF